MEESKHLNIQELMPGMPVAVFYGGLWQRAEVISSKDSEAFIYFIDIGCKKRVEVSCLRYLEKTFAMSPRMCYKGSLFGLKPFNGEKFWRAGAIMKFMSKTKGKKMYASIKDLKDDFFHLSIVDDLLKKTCVSDYLVEMGFAEQVMDFDYSKNAILVRTFHIKNDKNVICSFLDVTITKFLSTKMIFHGNIAVKKKELFINIELAKITFVMITLNDRFDG